MQRHRGELVVVVADDPGDGVAVLKLAVDLLEILSTETQALSYDEQHLLLVRRQLQSGAGRPGIVDREHRLQAVGRVAL